MITFLDLGLYGRLGNQLYQYAALRGISEKTGIECKIPDFHDYSWHGQKCLLNNFNLKAPPLEYADRMRVRGTHEEKSPNVFYEKFFSVNPYCNIKGFFQFTGYFDHCEDIIREEFTPKKFFLDKAEKLLEQHRKGGYEIVSIHIRRGDMMNYMQQDTGVSPYQVFGRQDIFEEGTVYGDYLSKAMKFFENKKVKFLVFTGGKRNGNDIEDIEYVKRVFKGNQYIFSQSNDAMMDFTTIMLCDHNITCHQSTFGWWAAFLNNNEHKVVTSPQNYFFLMPKEICEARISEGHFPKGWSIIK
mgnify:CR=1 FL=1|tara:strand:+ start:678 stop:1577 length:900 start_codon:yes stop_codon:yes gene_type:complete